jgi:hypothetical protein
VEDPFRHLTTADAIKSAYRKLCLKCHPDVRPDKEAAAIEFRELTRIYQTAMSMVGKVSPSPPPRPKPQRPKPPPPVTPLRETVYLEAISDFEIMTFGEAIRVASCSETMLNYGGSLVVRFRSSKKNKDIPFEFEVPKNTKNGQKFRFQLSDGVMELTLVSERK